MKKPLLAMLWLAVAAPLAADEQVSYEKDVKPLIAKYCLRCHRGDDPKAGLSLEGFSDAESLRAKGMSWEAVVDMLNAKLMPPEDQPQPSEADRRRLSASIEALLFHVDCKLNRDPGRVTIRRLNRNEYNNTVRDLLGVDLRPADDFPSDDVGEGFDNIGDVLTTPPLLMEKYLAAAEQLAEAAIIAPETHQPPTIRKQAIEMKTEGGGYPAGRAAYLVSSGSVTGQFKASKDGDYIIRLTAGADQAGPENAKAELRVNGKKIQVIDVDALRESPENYDVKTKLSQGDVKISAHFINDYYQPKSRDPKLRGDRNLLIDALELVGPLELGVRDYPESHEKLRVAKPASKKASWSDAALQCLRPVVQRAFRRRVSDAEVAPYVKLAEMAKAKGESFERGIQVALAGVLVSPQFLFRVERDPRPDDAQAVHDLDQFELASRLSYFLWSTMPDDTLFEIAATGKLNNDAVLRAQVKRMLQDPRANQLGEHFAGQWLNLRNLDDVTPDPKQFGKFDARLREDMKRETMLFFNHVLKEDRSILEFVDGQYTFVNERLAKHYGIEGVEGDDFRQVALPPERRVGVLGHASILTLTSNPTRTSPVKRGKWIMDNLLGTPPPDPPPGVPEFDAAQKAKPNASLREQLELHRSDASCSVCHRQMDPLGFGLQNFDAIGRWRDEESGRPIDASGVLPGGEQFTTPTELGRVLAGKRDEISRCIAEKMMTYALGRGLQYFDRCAVDKIIASLEQTDYRFQHLVTGIVLSDPFRRRRGEDSNQ